MCNTDAINRSSLASSFSLFVRAEFHFSVFLSGTTSRQKIEETGRRLVSFAQTMNLPFSSKLVMVSNMLYLKEDLFEIEADEAIAVYAPASLRP